jgi:hypothetical protein
MIFVDDFSDELTFLVEGIFFILNFLFICFIIIFILPFAIILKLITQK